MNLKKFLPFLLLIVMAILAITVRRCNETERDGSKSRKESKPTNVGYKAPVSPGSAKLDRTALKLFFTKHARCRMKCRHISQQEVKDILKSGTVNYNKSDLQDPRGATYAVEGVTRDRQRVRIIFSPRKEHLTVVTVIDLEVEYKCNCN